MEPRDPRVAPVDGDTLDHLWNAAHEMLSAMRTLLDAADEFVESQRNERPRDRGDRGDRDDRGAPEGRVHRIDIDVRADAPGPAAGAGTGAGTGAS